MFGTDELGLLAYLNDNDLASTNRSMLRLSSDAVANALDRYLSGDSGGDSLEEDRLLSRLNDRSISKDALARTTGRVRDYLNGGVKVVTYWDTAYPRNLRLGPDPPLIMYVNGSSFPGCDHVAVVGTVHPSKAGMDLAYEYGARIARRGRTVISGLARGIDAQALEGALGSDGAPIAMLGTPLTDGLPDDLKDLASEIVRKGAVISELTEEARLHPGRLLQRNRTIAGISGSVIVIESAAYGSVPRMVELALRQGRRAYVVQQKEFENPDHDAGFRKLGSMGAAPISHPEDVFAQEGRQGRLF